ncbi:response regulator [Wenxinia saemankumensis]|uniref:Response regulator receiver protein n=1 Tax=Wenxinia saemankumensis TaxID=1447782 RepID=A0A1M6BYV7_9RHOB|nr:response regulator [Wenxinia saemankumensis]SHI53628.1 response regulator receiver protein [Wenxinia saemankumensis]
MNGIDHMGGGRPAAPDRPLAGLTLLLVEDSRHAADGIRLFCQRAGARIRRADSLAAARRHLCVYRPGAVVVDMGLPDGTGAELIAELHAARPRIGILLGLSADPGARAAALQAGADGFLTKPGPTFAGFVALLGAGATSDGPALAVGAEGPSLRDDLARAEMLLVEEDGNVAYAAQFLGSLARASGDGPLARGADRLSGAAGSDSSRRDLARLVARRLDDRVEL